MGMSERFRRDRSHKLSWKETYRTMAAANETGAIWTSRSRTA